MLSAGGIMAGKEKNTAGSRSFTPRYITYSITDVIAAGGTTAFANKVGKNTANIQERLNKLPDDVFLTKEEADKALEMLNESK